MVVWICLIFTLFALCNQLTTGCAKGQYKKKINKILSARFASFANLVIFSFIHRSKFCENFSDHVQIILQTKRALRLFNSEISFETL